MFLIKSLRCKNVECRPQVLSELVESAHISEMQRWQMHRNITTMHDLLGGCERILRTPIPVAYTRHTTRFVILWMTLLPYALWAKFEWATIVIAPLIGVLLLGINEIGIDVEEPFSLLPLEAIADRAFMDCKQSIDMQVRLCVSCRCRTFARHASAHVDGCRTVL